MINEFSKIEIFRHVITTMTQNKCLEMMITYQTAKRNISEHRRRHEHLHASATLRETPHKWVRMNHEAPSWNKGEIQQT